MFTLEICDNRIDDDGDGKIDCFDGECDGGVICWKCDEDYYQLRSNSKLGALNPGPGAYYTVADIIGASQINGTQMSHYDGHVYAPCIIDGNHTLGLLKQDGTVVDMGLDLPTSSIFYVGGLDVDGKLYMSRGSGSIYYVDLTQAELTVECTSASATGVADFAVDNTNGLF